MAYDFAPFGVHALKKSGITKRRRTSRARSSAPRCSTPRFRLFPAFAKKVGLDAPSGEHVNLTPQLREQSLVQGTVDFISGHYFSSILDLEGARRGVGGHRVDATTVDFGMDVYGNGIIVSADADREARRPSTASSPPPLKAWKEVAANPQLGIAAAKKRDPLIDEKLETERLNMSLRTNMLTPFVKANGMGDVDPARFARSVKDVAEAFGLPAAPAPDKVFTSQVPAAQGGPHGGAERRGEWPFVELAGASVSTYRLGKDTRACWRLRGCHALHRQGRVHRRGRSLRLRQVHAS